MTQYVGAVGANAAGQVDARPTVSLVEIVISDRLEGSTVTAISARLEQILSLRPRRLVIDLADCPFADAVTIGLLLDVHRRLWRMDGLLSLRSPSPRMRRILRAARVDQVLHIAPGSEDPEPAETGSPPRRARVTGDA